MNGEDILNINREDILNEITELTERVSNLEKRYDSLTSSNKMWRAEKDSMYFYIDSEDEICSSLENGAATDNLRYDIGNYFKTEEEAKFEVERLKVIRELKKFSTPISDFDWNDDTQKKYTITIRNNLIRVTVYYNLQSSDLYFKSKKQAKNAIYSVGEDRIFKYYFRRGNLNGASIYDN